VRKGRDPQRQNSKTLLVLVFMVGVLAAVGSGSLFQAFVNPFKKPAPVGQPDFGLMEEAWRKIDQVYVDRAALEPRALTYGAITGMVEALGDTGHSTFLSPEMLKIQKNASQGKVEGIGAEVRMKGGQLVIVAPIDGSPAQRAGLHPGDVILKVDGASISSLPLAKAVEKILGKPGTSVVLTVLGHSTGITRDITLVRAAVTVHNVSWHLLPDKRVALVRIAGFSRDVTKGLEKILKDVQEQQVEGVILDLRNNPGGLFTEAIGVASQFLTGGNVLLEKDARGKMTAVPVRSGGLLPKTPLVVLVNGGSASAAEIVAGALRDAHRATLVGETTFGTGTVLNEFPLSDGSALLLAVREWFTPDGNAIWHKGIAPDVKVALPPEAMPLIPSLMGGLSEEALQKSGDTQLIEALNIIEGQLQGREPSPRTLR
jgi:carboxyl-terminal processing protease